LGITGAINFIVGYLPSARAGKIIHCTAGQRKHLQTDTWSTLGIIIGLALIIITGYTWLDGVVAIIFAFIILYTGYRIIRSSLAGIMDEIDKELLSRLVIVLNNNRHANINWIDLHNLRVIKYGGHFI